MPKVPKTQKLTGGGECCRVGVWGGGWRGRGRGPDPPAATREEKVASPSFPHDLGIGLGGAGPVEQINLINLLQLVWQRHYLPSGVEY